MKRVPSIGIVGGGTMGLTLAYRLGRLGCRVTVLESGSQIGGLATWFDYGDFVWDKYYHVIPKQDDSLLGLIGDLGLSEKMRWSETKTGFLWRGRHLSMSSNLEFLTFPALNLIQKFRLGVGLLRAQRIEDPTELERMTAAAWMERLFGRNVYEAMWEPLLESKYGVLKNEVPATIMWATIRRYAATRSKGAGKELMGFLSGGLKTLYDGLSHAIARQGGTIRCRASVKSIDATDPNRVRVDLGGEKLEFDRVISTVPTSVLRRVAPAHPDAFGPESGRPKFIGIILMALVLKRPLNPFYVTNLIQKGFPFTGVIGVSCLTGTEELNGRHLFMLPRYDVPESEWFAKSDEDVAREFLAALKPIYPDIEENMVRYFVNREKLVQALWVDKPPQILEPPRSRSGNLWNVNAELAGRDTLNNNAIVRVADRVAVEFADALPIRDAGDDGDGDPPRIAVAQ